MTSPLEVLTTKQYGRGLYATRRIRKGEVVERSPVLVVDHPGQLNSTSMNVYMFEWRRGNSALALGLGSLFNHSEKRSNVTYNPVYQDLQILFVATRDIRKGEQLMINYGYDPKKGREVTEKNLYHALKLKYEHGEGLEKEKAVEVQREEGLSDRKPGLGGGEHRAEETKEYKTFEGVSVSSLPAVALDQ